MSKTSLPVVLSDAEMIRLEQWIRAGSTPQQVVLRARIIRAAAQGQSDKATASALEIRRETAALWRRRVREQGIGCVWEIAAGRGRKPSYAAARVGQWIDATLQTKPAGATHWSTRTLARAQGVSKNTIQRAWQDHGLKPHLTKSFKLSRDPKFLEKLTDVVGVYLTPPQNAIVLCVDEKSQIQALDRTQPGLPLKPGRCGTYTHDYHRHGTTTLFAALQLVEGRVIGQCYPRHRHQEFLKFLQRLDAEFPDGKALHLILDNYGTHGHERVRRWLKRHPRFVLHFIPTSSSWLNLVERWFAELSQKAVRRGVFHSVADLQCAIADFLTAWNAAPAPFVWTASVEAILAKIARARHRLEQIEPGSTLPKRVPPPPPTEARRPEIKFGQSSGAYADSIAGHYTSQAPAFAPADFTSHSTHFRVFPVHADRGGVSHRHKRPCAESGVSSQRRPDAGAGFGLLPRAGTAAHARTVDAIQGTRHLRTAEG